MFGVYYEEQEKGALTGSASNMRSFLMSNGTDDYLAKPFFTDELLTT